MPRIRCTQRLLKLLGKEAVRAAREDDSEESDLDWYANLFWVEGRKCLIFVNAGTLFPVVALDVLKDDFRDPAKLLRDRYRRLLLHVEAPEDEVERELALFEEMPIGKTLNRSVLGSLTEYIRLADGAIEDFRGRDDLRDQTVSAQLAKTPMGGIGMGYPGDLLKERVPGMKAPRWSRRYDLPETPPRERSAVHPAHSQNEVLADFLDRPDRPKGSLNYQQLLGFMFYVAASPEPIIPSEWFTLVLGGDDLVFDGPDQASKVFGALIEEYNCVTQDVQNAAGVDPDYTPLQDDPMDNFERWTPVNNWCLGFAFGYHWASGVWGDIPEDLEGTVQTTLLILQVFASKEVAHIYMKQTGQQDRGFNEVVTEVAGLFYDASRYLADVGRRYRKTPESMFPKLSGDGAPGPAPKVGRNEPCPCGSGKKYKHCHGRAV